MDTTTPLERFVAELVAIGGQLTTTLDHMHRFQTAAGAESAPDSIPDTLGRLLEGILAGPSVGLADRELDVAAAALRTASMTIATELLLVAPPNRAERRAARRRPRGCG